MLAITGGKGGCGKTTVTLGLTTALARRGRRTLAVDADRDMPDLHALAGVDNDRTVAAVADGDRLESVVRPIPGRPRAGVLPTAPGVSRAESHRALRRLSVDDVPTLVDCPAGAGPAAVAPLRVADAVVVTVAPTTAGIRDAVKAAGLARGVASPVAAVAVVGVPEVPERVADLFAAPAVPIPETDRPRVTALGPATDGSTDPPDAGDPVGRAFDDLAQELPAVGMV